ncbi:MAG: tetratricopeptide repeat protein [Planctomycetes bacterium]|nr:tetratricopeptide repeat protein [Planctomycetota bacterium]
MPTTALDVARLASAAGRWADAWLALEPFRRGAAGATDFAVLTLAHRIALRLGLDTQRAWTLRALTRRHPGRRTTHTLSVCELLRRGRPFDALELLTSRGLPEPLDPTEAVGAELARARVRSQLRDFALAHAALAAAEALDADDPRIAAERAWTLQDEDRRADALAACRDGRRRWPTDPLLAELECWLLDDAGRQGAHGGDGAEEALAVLAERASWLQCPQLGAMLAERRFERGELELAEAAAQAVLAREPHGRRVATGMRSLLVRIARTRGDDAAARHHAAAGGRALRSWAERLAAPAMGPRVVLPVPYVRQDYVTCSPATMASLLAFHGHAIAQAEIAAQITYDGTPDHGELNWASEHGLAIRFFEFDAEGARRLIDLGQPFAISMRAENSGHRVALCGYDAALRTFVLRDPGSSLLREVDADWLTTVTADKGGLCALIAPRDVMERVPMAALPRAEACLELVRLRHDLAERRLSDAERRAAALEAQVDGTLRWEARFAIASEHRDRRAVTRLFRERLDARPDDGYWQNAYVWALGNEGRWQEMRAFLEERCADRRASPHLLIRLADHVRENANDRPHAERLVRRALRRLGLDARAARTLPDVIWHDVARRAEAAELYRVVSCIGPFDESLARSCGLAFAQIGRVDDGLAWLRERAARLGARSPNPSITLAAALRNQDRLDEALDVLRDACARHDDVDLHLELFDALLAAMRLDEAGEALEAIGTRGRAVSRELAAHRLARARGDHEAALAALERAVAADPRMTEVQERRLLSLLEQRGREAAVAAADALVATQGDDPHLAVVALDFFDRVEDRVRAGTLLRRLVAEHPAEPWLRARLASHLVVTGEPAAALRELEQLQSWMPDAARTWIDTARAHAALGELPQAHAAARRALELDPHETQALRLALEYCQDRAAADRVLRDLMARWPTATRAPGGEAVNALLHYARGAVEDGELEAFLGELEARFTDARDLRLARVRQLGSRSRQEALERAEALAADFPWDAEVARVRGRCLRELGRHEEERRVLEELLARYPGDGAAWVQLGASFESEGRFGDAREAYERGLARVPGHPYLHGWHADVLWRLGERDRAIAAVARACELDRDYSWAFAHHIEWLGDVGREPEALAVAEELVRSNPHWATAHDLHALALGMLGRHEERLAALRRALTIDPRVGRARESLIDGLLDLKRFDEARAVVAEGLRLLGDDPDLALVDARILRTQGELPASRTALRALLARHADHEAGWNTLLGWLDEEGLHDEILAVVAEAPAALATSPVLDAYAADVHFARGDQAAAEHALRNALAKDKGHAWSRRRLARHLLETDRAAQVLELLGDGDPQSMPAWHAALVAQAAAACGRLELAERGFRRLLLEEEIEPSLIAELDAALAKVDPASHARRLRELATDGATVVRENLLHLEAKRGNARDFFAGLTKLGEGLERAELELRASRLLYTARGTLPVQRIARWVERRLAAPIADVDAFGRLAYALSSKAGARVLVDLAGDTWRRPGIRGWMLANLASACADLGRDEDTVAVARHALDNLPHDHSSWWHQRYLRDVALKRGDHAACLADDRLPPLELAGERLRWRVQRLLAGLRAEPKRRARLALLRGTLPELIREYDRARRDERSSLDAEDLRGRELRGACLCLTTWMLGFGEAGLRQARMLRLLPREG